ncbi:MAG TPA: hypothetical protein VGX92_09220 [Pyrinomonadaceae bacterium]|jgi:hypothetical protein|nr:hypothetical protein [Pyrinomonadaceae bacterium]
MLVECVARPELRAPVHELIARIQQAHVGGEFTIALSDMFASFGLSLGAAEWARLRQRGDVRFTPQSPSQGTFMNREAQQELPTDEGLTIVIPQTLSGDYITTPTSLTLKFAEGSALRGCKRVFVLICQDIIKIDADEHKLYIDLPGEKYDLCFVF